MHLVNGRKQSSLLLLKSGKKQSFWIIFWLGHWEIVKCCKMRPFLSNFQTLWFVQVVSFAENFLFSTEFVNKKWRTNKNLARRLVLHLMQVYCRYYATTKKMQKNIFFMIFHEFRWDSDFLFALAFFYKVGKFLRAEKRNVSAKEGMQLTKKSRLQIFDCKNGSASFDLENPRIFLFQMWLFYYSLS